MRTATTAQSLVRVNYSISEDAAGDRPRVNSDGMRTTLARLKRELETTG